MTKKAKIEEPTLEVKPEEAHKPESKADRANAEHAAPKAVDVCAKCADVKQVEDGFLRCMRQAPEKAGEESPYLARVAPQGTCAKFRKA